MLSTQIVKFIIIGLLNTLVGYSLYALFLFLGFGFTFSLSIATVLGVVFNFQTIGKLVFKSHDGTLIFKFVLVYIVVFGTNLLLIQFMVNLGRSAYVAGAVALLPTAVMSFVLNKYLVFKR